MHTVICGVAHNAVADDGAALDLVRRYLAFFPSNAWTAPARRATDDGARALDEILDVIPADPRHIYDIRPVLELISDLDGDAHSVLEIQPRIGRSIVTALVRIGGWPVAVVANQPAVKAGAIDARGGRQGGALPRGRRRVRPSGGVPRRQPGRARRDRGGAVGILRHAARMYAAQARVRGPKLHVTLRKAYGFGSSLMAMNPFDAQTITLAFPGARLGAMPAESGADAAGIEPDVRTLIEHAELGGAYASADTHELRRRDRSPRPAQRSAPGVGSRRHPQRPAGTCERHPSVSV